jgi:hypothetical protein
LVTDAKVLGCQASLRMLGLAQSRAAASALASMLALARSQVHGLHPSLLGLAAVKCILSIVRDSVEGAALLTLNLPVYAFYLTQGIVS